MRVRTTAAIVACFVVLDISGCNSERSCSGADYGGGAGARVGGYRDLHDAEGVVSRVVEESALEQELFAVGEKLAAALPRSSRNPLKAATFQTLIGLLAVTGMRGSEAMRLADQDLDAAGRLTIRATKFRKSRQLPLHATTLQALVSYQVLRDRLCPAPATASLLVSTTGARLCHETVQPVFRLLLRQAGIGQGTPRPRATIHGVRHTFAVNTTRCT